MKRGRRFEAGLIFPLVFVLLGFLILTGKSMTTTALAATEQAVEPEGTPNDVKVNDPYEHSNRVVFDFNDKLYFQVLKPVDKVYSVFPLDFREAVSHGFHNVIFPGRFINFVLQGKPDKAANETARFLINTILGGAGLFEIAQRFGYVNHEADFGQTLALWGVGSGDFLMIPLLGPSDTRDLIGYAADSAMDPLVWLPTAWWVTFSTHTGKFVNYTSLHGGEYEEMKKAALDPYVATRDAYMQYREHMISK
jgi:phospholipid-binding lipoprotein MlaA